MDIQEENFNLDISWLNDLNKQGNADDESTGTATADEKEKEPMSHIHISFIYVNLNNEIHKIVSEKHELDMEEDDSDPFLSKDAILSLVSDKIKFEKMHYRLSEILLFNVDLEPSQISSLDSSECFIQKISILDDIVIPASVPIFHSTNGLFFIFKEISTLKKPSLTISSSLELEPDEIIKPIQTRKHRSSLAKHTRKHKLSLQ